MDLNSAIPDQSYTAKTYQLIVFVNYIITYAYVHGQFSVAYGQSRNEPFKTNLDISVWYFQFFSDTLTWKNIG